LTESCSKGANNKIWSYIKGPNEKQISLKWLRIKLLCCCYTEVVKYCVDSDITLGFMISFMWNVQPRALVMGMIHLIWSVIEQKN